MSSHYDIDMNEKRARIVDRLRRQADQRFVGREPELALMREALGQTPPPFSVLIVHGPGGIGKTAITERFRTLAADAGMACLRIDARDLPVATPQALLSALALALNVAPQDAAPELLAAILAACSAQPRRLLVIDTFELLSAHECWLRDQLLAELPEQTMVVLAGRQAPSRHWQMDPVWSGGVHTMGLRNLTPADCERLLAQRRIEATLSAATLRLTHGHPLALTLLADVIQAQGSVPDKLGADVIRQLTDCMVSHVPSDLHRAALEACACTRATTQDLLADVVDASRAAELFEWLASRAYVEAGPLGLFPHDLVRDAVAAELKWRHRSRAIELASRLRDHHVRRMAGASASVRNEAALDILYLQRHSPVMRRFVDFDAVGAAYFEAARSKDIDAIAALVLQELGPQSEQQARRWWGHPAARFWVARDAQQRLVGATFFVNLAALDEEAAAQDPGLLHAAQWVAANAPARPGEAVLCTPYVVAEGGLHTPSAAMNTLQMCMVMHWLTMPGLAVFLITADVPAYWEPMMRYIDFHPIATPPFAMDGRQAGLFMHDWRVVPPEQWLNLVTIRAQEADAREPPPDSASQACAPLLVLSRTMFDRAVKDALRQLANPAQLDANPLARSRLVHQARQPDDLSPGRTLMRLLREAVSTLGEHPRNQKFQRALALTYLTPVGSQELVAERLGLPFSTYRYQLGTGIERVTAFLWRMETAAVI